MQKEIPEHHYEAVLRYMQSTGSQDFQNCYKVLAQHHFQLQEALQNKSSIYNENQYVNHNSLSTSLSENNHNDEMIQFSQSDVEKLRERLFKRKQTKNTQNSMKTSIFKKCESCLKCFRFVKRSLKKKISYFQKEKIFYFNQIYSQINNNLDFIEPYELESIEETIKQQSIIQNRKPFALILSSNRSSFLLEKFLSNKDVTEVLNKQFYIAGLTLTQIRDLKMNKKKVLREINRHPAIVIYTLNQFDQFQTIQKWMGEDIERITANDILQAKNKCIKLNNRKKIVNQIQSQFKSIIGRQNQQHLMENYFQSNFLTQDEDEYDYYQNLEQTQTPIQEHKEIIAEQTSLYQEMEKQESIRKKSIQLQKQKIQEMLTQRQARKLSLSDYEADNSIAIQFKFRCPDGRNLTKKFNKHEKLEILYHFVETHDEIQFENEPERNFQLYTSYPPKALGQLKNQQLIKIFDEPIENIMIRQL